MTTIRDSKQGRPEVSELLERARVSFERHEWNDAFEALSLADQATPLDADDLQRLAWSAGLTARDEEMRAIQERGMRIPDDVAVTRAIVQAGKLLDVVVLDHLVIGHGKWVSLKERGLGFS